MFNYYFCTETVKGYLKDKNHKVLDYGCGSGEIISALKDCGIDAYGCEIFYEASKAREKVPKSFLKNGTIKHMESIYKIPFPEDSFDIIISNMVLEHVKDLDATLKEFKRVLTKEGLIISLFPSKESWRESHCGLWFLHWFPPKSKLRYYYALLLRIFGFGYHKEGKSISQWCIHKCNWLDNWTYYRSKKDIKIIFNKYFKYSKNIEKFYLKKKFPMAKYLVDLIPTKLINIFINKFATLAFISSSNRKRILEL